MTTPNLRSKQLFTRLSTAGAICVILLPVFGFQQPLLAANKSADRDEDKPYALIFGTVWGPDNRPVYGVPVKIRRAKDKKPKWEVYSDHHGEFAQRVPAGESDYILSADLKHVKSADGKPLRAPDVTVHIYNDEREDTGVHLTY